MPAHSKHTCCSQCGQSGHNIRTCPTLGRTRNSNQYGKNGQRHHTLNGWSPANVRKFYNVSSDFVLLPSIIGPELRAFHIHYQDRGRRAIRNDIQYQLFEACLQAYPLCPITEWIKKSGHLWNNYIFIDAVFGYSRFYLGAFLEMFFIEQKQLCFVCGHLIVPTPITQNSGYTIAAPYRCMVDHNHRNFLVRKLVCSYCNCMLGFAKENEGRLAQGIAYLHNVGSYEW